MATYIMALRGKGNPLNKRVWNTQASSMSEAKDYFVRLKRLATEDFDRIFVVVETEDADTSQYGDSEYPRTGALARDCGPSETNQRNTNNEK